MSKLLRKLISGYQYIREQAFPISKVEEKITNLSNPLIEHLIKVLKWEDSQNNPKHLRDIDNWLFQVRSIHNSSKTKVKRGRVYSWLYGEKSEELISDWIDHLGENRGYDSLRAYRENTSVEISLNKIFEEIDSQLSSTGKIDKITNILKKLNVQIKGV